MQFINHTSFPAIRWYNVDKEGKDYNTVVVRIKLLFDKVTDTGLWQLKLSNDQGELFNTDQFYGEVGKSAVRFESDFVPYKPHADFIINGYARAPHNKGHFFVCGTKIVRYGKESQEILLEKHLKVYGKRYWKETLLGWEEGNAELTDIVSLRYKNAYGGSIENPDYLPSNEKEMDEYLDIYKPNPIGKGLYIKNMNTAKRIEMPQIESFSEKIIDIKKHYTPQGFGIIHRSWEPRISLAGTFDDDWKRNKHPIMPDDYKESHNNAAHPDLQLKKGYFKINDTIFFKNILPGKSEQAIQIPGFYFKGFYHKEKKKTPFFLELDTVIVDVLEEDMHQNAIYLTYRARVPHMEGLDAISLEMLVSESFISHKGEVNG